MENMPRVGMAVFSYYPADPRVRREAEVLARAGYEVDVICLGKAGETPFERFGSITAYRVMKGTERKENLIKYFALSGAFAVLAFAKLLSLSLRHRYHLIQVHNMPDHLVFVGLLHKLAGVPVMIDLHDLTVELFESKTNGSVLGKLLPVVKFVERLSCDFADGVLTTSPGFRQKLLERGIAPKKVTLVFNSADSNLFKMPPRRSWNVIEEGPALLYHGTVARRFGLHVSIEAVAELRKRLPATKLLIYGKYDPAYREELIELVRRLGLEDNVEIGGYLPFEKISETIGRSDIGVVSYLNDPFMNLALSTKIFEYVCMGMPVVAARLDSIKSVFDEESIKYFNPGDPVDLAARIEEFCKDPEARKRFTERAAAEYEVVSWPVMSERYLNTVNELIFDDDKNGA